jgi:hypothetical protein
VFFDTILNGLAEWEVQWEEGCETFGAGRYSRTLTGFVEGLRVISRKHLGDDVNMFIVIDKAERFKETLPELVVPMTRLADSVSHVCVRFKEVEVITKLFFFEVRFTYYSSVYFVNNMVRLQASQWHRYRSFPDEYVRCLQRRYDPK